MSGLSGATIESEGAQNSSSKMLSKRDTWHLGAICVTLPIPYGDVVPSL